MPSRTSADVAKFVDRIQGNILEGFNKDNQDFLFLRFLDQTSAREWLAGIADEVASVAEVRDFNHLFKRLKARRGGELGMLKATWMNIAFSFAGLKALGVGPADLARFPRPFSDGMLARAGTIGDVGQSDPAGWIPPFRKSGGIHAVMIVASDSQEDLGEHTLRYIHNMGINGGVQLVYLQEGSVREDEPGHEHFGFRDGVSQPAVRHYNGHGKNGEPIQGHPGQDRLHAGEFLLGYPTQVPAPKPCPRAGTDPVFLNPNPDEGPISPLNANETAPDWATDGSYLVFRRLAQDVRGFREFIAKKSLEAFPALAKTNPQTAIDAMGAKIVGRYRSGCPLELTKDQVPLIGNKLPANFDPAAGDPSLLFPKVLGDDKNSPDNIGNLAEDSNVDNHFEYHDDPEGRIVPRGSHIRKAYPRDSATPGGGESDTQTHRLLRRGIPFGTSFRPSLGATGHGGKAGVEEPGDRGLLFLCYQSSLARQFEFVQTNWVNNPNFPGKPKPPTDPDPKTGLWTSDLDPSDPDGQDPVIAQNTPDGPMKVPSGVGVPDNPRRFTMTHFVTTTGGEYFFQPSIEAIHVVLAGKASPFDPGGLPGAVFNDNPGGIDFPGFDPCQAAIADAGGAVAQGQPAKGGGPT